MQGASLVVVVVLIYLDDVLVVGRGFERTRAQCGKLATYLGEVGAVVSGKSTL